MGKRVLVIVLVLLLAVFAYVGYHSYDAQRAGATGDVFSNDGPLSTKSGSNRSSDSAEPEPAVVYPKTTQNAAQTVPEAGSQTGQTTQAGQEAPATIPGSDTISPNPPNGMVFSGTGAYQLYRQGNITWRVNTTTGETCIIFATDEEWKKPKVFRAGCGNRK